MTDAEQHMEKVQGNFNMTVKAGGTQRLVGPTFGPTAQRRVTNSTWLSGVSFSLFLSQQNHPPIYVIRELTMFMQPRKKIRFSPFLVLPNHTLRRKVCTKHWIKTAKEPFKVKEVPQHTINREQSIITKT